MAFADWKKRSHRYGALLSRLQIHGTQDIEEVCQAAYKAGERNGRKKTEAIAMNAIELRNILAKAKA